jgi:Protein of unknown function (DUF2568)
MLTAAQNANLLVRFLLELALLTVVGLTAWRSLRSPVWRGIAVVAAPAAVAVGWAVLVQGDVSAPVRAGAQLAALLLGVGCLLRLGTPRLAGALTAVALLNAALLVVWNQ